MCRTSSTQRNFFFFFSLSAGASGWSHNGRRTASLTCVLDPIGDQPSSRVCRPRAGGDAGSPEPDALATTESTSLGCSGPASRGLGRRLAEAVRSGYSILFRTSLRQNPPSPERASTRATHLRVALSAICLSATRLSFFFPPTRGLYRWSAAREWGGTQEVGDNTYI